MPRKQLYTLPKPAIVGVVHLPPLPGTPGAEFPIREICKYAAAEAGTLARAGFDAVVIENFGDAPFFADRVPPHTVAAMTVVARAVRKAVDLPLGINVLRNDAMSALAIAVAVEAAFVRVNILTGVYATDQGVIEGRAAEVIRYRSDMGVPTAILADVHVKHAAPLNQPNVILAAEETAYRGNADGLILTGATTGRPADFDAVKRVRAAIPDKPVLIGSGITAETVGTALQVAEGVIVGTAIKRDGVTTNPVDPDRASHLIRAARPTH